MALKDFIFTSECVSEGHPDKVADQISDSIMDALIAKDAKSRVARETMVTTGMALIAGEISTDAYVDMPSIVRNTIREIGYTDAAAGFDAATCAVLTSIDQQSSDISQGVTEGAGLYTEQGAGDQARDDGQGQRLLDLGAGADPQGQRQKAQRRGEGGDEDGAQARPTGRDDALVHREFGGFTQLVDAVH